MAENPLVALVAAVRTALNTPLESATTDKAGQTARLDLIDLIPDLQRQLIGEQATIRNMTWQVDTTHSRLVVTSPTNLVPIPLAPKPRNPASNKPLQNCSARATRGFNQLH
jgi:hypothetical protein